MTPSTHTPGRADGATRLGRVFGVLISWRFLANLVIILIATSWLPLMSRTMVLTNSDGEVIQEFTATARPYESWRALIRGTPGVRLHVQNAALHFGVCFVVAFGVWYMAAGTWKRTADPPEQTPTTSSSDDVR